MADTMDNNIKPILNENPEIVSDEKQLPIVLPSSIQEAALLRLSAFKVVSLTYIHEDKECVNYFTTGENKSSFFDEQTRTFRVINYFKEKEQLIPESCILQIRYPAGEEYIQEFYQRAEREKQEYKEVVESYKSIADFTDIEEMPKEKAYAAIYGLSVSELQDTKKCKDVVMNYITIAIDNEIKKLTEEFGTADASEELQQIINFINLTREDYSIFEKAKNYQEIITCWPAILSPSYFSNFLNYINKSNL